MMTAWLIGVVAALALGYYALRCVVGGVVGMVMDDVECQMRRKREGKATDDDVPPTIVVL